MKPLRLRLRLIIKMSNKAQLAAITKRLKKYAEKDIPAATRTAANQTAKVAKTRVVKAISKQAKVPPKQIRNRAKVTKGYGVSFAKLSLNVKGVSLINLNPRKNKRGVRAYGRQFDGHFIGRLKAADNNRYRHVLYRREELRKPDEKAPLWLPRIPIKIATQEITPKVIRREFKSSFQKRYLHEINRRRSRG